MGALDGIRVIDFGQWIAGPLAAMMLADQGAEVIHVDPPGGPRWQTLTNATLNRGKQCMTLDLKTEQGHAAARRLIDAADIVVENFRPGVMERLGLGPEASTGNDARLIYCSIPGFASDDPRAGMPAWEGVVAAATGSYPPQPGSEGDQPRFTALPIASDFGALAAATAIAMALVARERDGLGQRIEVPLFDAMFTAIGAGGLLVNGAPAGGRPDDPWGGLFQCADGGWVRINLATPRFVRRFVEEAGKLDWVAKGYLEPGRLASGTELRKQQQREMLDCFRTRTADEWEALGQRADVPLTRVRTSAEWLQTAQAREAGIVLPLDDPELGAMLQPGLAVRLGGAPGAVKARSISSKDAQSHILQRANRRPSARESSNADRLGAALEGIRVVDVTQVLAGPTAGRTLAEYGAEVVKINNPWEEGAGYRWNVHRYHTDVNRGKSTILLDLKTREGLDVFQRLVERADVVIQNFRLGVAERRGIGYERVKALRPEIIYGSVSMYGRGGPWENLPGYEVNAQTVAGMVARMEGNGQPFAVDDYATGLLEAFGIGLALFHRLRTGKGQFVESALARTATVLQTPFLQSYEGKVWDEPSGRRARGWGALQRLYRAADGWFFLGAEDSQLSRLASIEGLEALAGREGENVELVFEGCFAQKTAAEWIDLLAAAGVGAQPVRSPLGLMKDPWIVAHGLSLTRPHRDGSLITTVGPPARLSRTPVQPGRPVSPPGGDAEEILASIGMAGQLTELAAKRVLALE